MTYGYLKPQKCTVTYVPRIFGFKVSSPQILNSEP